MRQATLGSSKCCKYRLGCETCVGFAFPALGTLRARLVPPTHRSALAGAFGAPMNLSVAAVHRNAARFGPGGALGCAAVGIAASCAAAFALRLTLWLYCCERKARSSASGRLMATPSSQMPNTNAPVGS